MKPPNFRYLPVSLRAVQGGVKYQINFLVPRVIFAEVLKSVLGPVFMASENTAVRRRRRPIRWPCQQSGSVSLAAQRLAPATCAQAMAGHFAIIKRKPPGADHLPGLMTTTGNQNTVADLRLRKCNFDSTGSIKFNLYVNLRRNPPQNILDNGHRILSGRVIVGEDQAVGLLGSNSPEKPAAF
ncbi:MAG: hypothetical protein OSA43_05525, partial [Pirellulales bacterium]|nr:hypothetical protein [Pirellulales bacterium]